MRCDRWYGPQEFLYNLAVDIGERNDLAAAQPNRVRSLKAFRDAWEAKVDAERKPPAGVGSRPRESRP
jgi:hypothetical protein